MLDVVVIGMGAHGSAGLFHLAKKVKYVEY